MYKLEEFKRLVRDFSDVADFLVVYVAEAHSTGQEQRLLLQQQGPHSWFKSALRCFVVVHWQLRSLMIYQVELIPAPQPVSLSPSIPL